MNPEWHYLVEGQSRGPVTLDQLQRWIEDDRLLPKDMVWRAGTADWVEAGRVPELMFPPPKAGQKAARPARERDARDDRGDTDYRQTRDGRVRVKNREFSTPELRIIAGWHRRLILVILAVVFLMIGLMSVGACLGDAASRLVVSMIYAVIVLSAGVLSLVCIFCLAAALKSNAAIFLALLGFVPLLGLVTLLYMSQTAIGVLNRHGIQVGFLGVDPNTIRRGADEEEDDDA